MSKVNNNENFVVMSDFHGMKGAMNVVRKYVEEGKKVYILGDATDRGPDGVEILLEIMDLSKKDKVCYIPGNHDQFIYNSYRSNDENWKRSVLDIWTIANKGGNGGIPTWSNLESLKETNLNKFNELMDWLGKQPLQRIVESNNKKYCLAHAFFDQKLYNENSLLCLDDCKDFTFDNPKNISQNILWFRKKDGSYQAEQLPDKNATVIIGHTQTDIDLSKDSYNLKNEKTGEEIKVINVDGGLVSGRNGLDKMIVFDSEDEELRLVSTSIEKQKQSEEYINKVVSNKKSNTKEVVVESSEIPSIAEQSNKSSSSIHPSNDEMHYAGTHFLSQDAMEPAIDEEQCKELFKILSSNLDVEKEDLKKDGNITNGIDRDFDLLQSRKTELVSNASLRKSRVSEIIKEVIKIREKYHLAIDGVDEIAEFVKKNDISLDDEYLRKVKNFNQQLKEKYVHSLPNDLSSEGVQNSKKLESLELPVENNSSILSADKCKELLKILEPALDGKFIEYANNHYSNRENFSAPEKFKLFEHASDDSKYFEDIKEKLLKANSISVEEAKKIADKIKKINESWLQYIRPDKKKWSEPRYDEDKVNEFFKSINNPDDILGKNSVNPVLESKSVESVDVLNKDGSVSEADIKVKNEQSLNHSDVEQNKELLSSDKKKLLSLVRGNKQNLKNILACYVGEGFSVNHTTLQHVKSIFSELEEIEEKLSSNESLSQDELLKELNEVAKIYDSDFYSSFIRMVNFENVNIDGLVDKKIIEDTKKTLESYKISEEYSKDLSSGIESSSNIDKVLLNLVESLSEKLGERGTKKTISDADKGKYLLLQEKVSELAEKVKKGESLTERETNFLNNIMVKFPEIVDEIQQNNLKNELSDIELQEASSDKIKVHQSSENNDIDKNNETYDLVVKLSKELEQLEGLTPADKTQVKIDCAKLKSILKKIEGNKIEEKDQKELFEIFNKYSEKMREIEPDEEKLSAIKANLLADSKKGTQDELKVMQSVSDEQISSLIEDLYNEIKDLYENPDGSMNQNDVYGKLVVLEKIKSSLKNQTLSSQDKQNIKAIFKFVEENITNSNVLTEENKKIIDEIDKSLKHDNESNDQLVDLIDAMVLDLENISTNTEIMANNQDDYNAALSFMSDLDDLRGKVVKNELETKDIEMISKAIQFIQSFDNEHAEELEINKDEFKDIIDGYKLVGLIGAMLIDLNNIKDNTEIMANNQEAYDTALHFMSDLDNLRKRAAKNELEAEDIETISKAIQFIQSFENEYAEDFEINKDEFKDVIDGFREEALYKDLISFIDDAVKKIDDESNNVRGSKKFNLNRASNDLVKLSKKIKNGGNITDRDVKKFRKVLNNDNVQEILDLSDEAKERYIKTLESLVDKEKDRKDNQTNDGQRGAGEEPDADELGVAKIEKDEKTYLKALAGAAGFAFGAVLGYTVPFPAGLVVTYGIQAVKIATRIASHSLAGKDNKITKVINVAKEKFPRINKFIKSSYVKWAFNGFTLGYTAGTIANKIHKPNLDKTAGGDNSNSHRTPDGTTATDKIPVTDKTPATDGIVHDPTGVGDEPENIVTSLQKGDRWNIRKVAGGYGYDSSTMDRRVHLDKDFTNDVIIGKSKIVDGEKMVLVKDNKTKEALAWLKESDILNQGRKR